MEFTPNTTNNNDLIGSKRINLYGKNVITCTCMYAAKIEM